MSIVGKKFPNIEVKAMNEMGDDFNLNILEEATSKKKKVNRIKMPLKIPLK